MNKHAAALIKLAQENPFWHFNAEELASMLNLSRKCLEMMKRTLDTPFVTGKARPEQVLDFLSRNRGWKPSLED